MPPSATAQCQVAGPSIALHAPASRCRTDPKAQRYSITSINWVLEDFVFPGESLSSIFTRFVLTVKDQMRVSLGSSGLLKK